MKANISTGEFLFSCHCKSQLFVPSQGKAGRMKFRDKVYRVSVRVDGRIWLSELTDGFGCPS